MHLLGGKIRLNEINVKLKTYALMAPEPRAV
jgi:hypothetical protein